MQIADIIIKNRNLNIAKQNFNLNANASAMGNLKRP